jgi:hypothetical protein
VTAGLRIRLSKDHSFEDGLRLRTHELLLCSVPSSGLRKSERLDPISLYALALYNTWLLFRPMARASKLREFGRYSESKTKTADSIAQAQLTCGDHDG